MSRWHSHLPPHPYRNQSRPRMPTIAFRRHRNYTESITSCHLWVFIAFLLFIFCSLSTSMLQLFSCVHNCIHPRYVGTPLMITHSLTPPPSLMSNLPQQPPTTTTTIVNSGELSFVHLCLLTDIHTYMHVHPWLTAWHNVCFLFFLSFTNYYYRTFVCTPTPAQPLNAKTATTTQWRQHHQLGNCRGKPAGIQALTRTLPMIGIYPCSHG